MYRVLGLVCGYIADKALLHIIEHQAIESLNIPCNVA